MTPEQMAAAAKQQCIFCHISAGRAAAKKVYEDEHVLAVLDINPANPGHILLVTKEHYMVMPQIPEDVIKHIGMVTKHLSMALLRALKAQGTTVFVANGVAAGQRAQHFMLHIIPRMEGDGIGLSIPEFNIGDADYKKIYTALKQGIGKTLGVVEGLEEETEKEEEMIEKAEEKVEKKEEAVEAEVVKEKKAKKKTKKEEVAEAEEIIEEEAEEAPEEEETEEDEEPEEETEEDKERKKLDDIANLFT